MSRPGADPAATGARIEQLLEASSASGPVARARAEELVRLVVDLYGAGLERLLELTHQAGRLDDALLEALAEDQLVSSLLLVHGLHPYGVADRVERALRAVQQQGIGVRLLSAHEDSVAVQLLDAEHRCGTDAAQAVRDAVAAAAPEVERVEVAPAPRAATVIPVDALTARLRPDGVLA